jgi:hypothetical protein
MADFTEPQNRDKALECLNHLVADALNHIPDVFHFMGQLQNQRIFNFCAIPQVMAIATLDLCYNNYEVFQRNVKIRKGQAVAYVVLGAAVQQVNREGHPSLVSSLTPDSVPHCRLMLRAQSMDTFYDIFAEHIANLKRKVRRIVVVGIVNYSPYRLFSLLPNRLSHQCTLMTPSPAHLL